MSDRTDDWKEKRMAKDGFLVIDSDMPVMEPPDLRERYIDAEFRPYAPHGVTSANVRDLRLAFTGDRLYESRYLGLQGHNYERNQKLYADHARRGWTSECQLEAMDIEGIDVAVLFPSRGLHALDDPRREPRFAAAIARAYNDWMYDFC